MSALERAREVAAWCDAGQPLASAPSWLGKWPSGVLTGVLLRDLLDVFDEAEVNRRGLAEALNASATDLAAARAREQRLREALRNITHTADPGHARDLARAALAAEPAADDGIDRPNEWTASNVPKVEYRESGSAGAAADEPGERE